MIEWLCKAFGFERHLIVEDGKGGIAHAQLTLGPGSARSTIGTESRPGGDSNGLN